MDQSLKQGSPEWLAMRRNYIGASDAPVIMGVSPYKTKYQLWEEKIGLSGEVFSNPATIYGQKMEEPARQAYEKQTGNLVTPAVVFHPNVTYMMASLDGLSFDKKIAVEIKNCCEEDHLKAKKSIVPEKYFPQIQHQLAVLGHDMMHYYSFRGGEGILVEVRRDDDYIEKLFAAEKDFWDNVQSLKEPKLSEKDYFVNDSEEWLTIANAWKETSVQIKELMDREQQFRDLLVDIADNRNVKGGGVRLTKIVRKGAVDYSKVKELDGVDLEKFRKDPTISWRIT